MFGSAYHQSRSSLSLMPLGTALMLGLLGAVVHAQSATTMPTSEPTSEPTTQGTSGPVIADPIIVNLDRAKTNYRKSLSDWKQALLAAIDGRIAAAADAGDLNLVMSLKALRAKAEADGSIPANEKDPSIRAAKTRYDQGVQSARLQLAAAYRRAVHDLTRTRQFEQAEKIQAEFDALPELHKPDTGTELINTMRGSTGREANGSIVLQDPDRIDTDAAFRAPVTFKITLMTNGDTRLAYAADQIIFNWPIDENQLRIDGGPAGGSALSGAGAIPKNKWVEITLTVLPDSLTIAVDGDMRYRVRNDFSHVNQSLSIFCASGSVVTVKSVIVIQGP